jgi:hypothetical protein
LGQIVKTQVKNDQALYKTGTFVEQEVKDNERCLNHFSQYLRGEYNEQTKKIVET